MKIFFDTNVIAAASIDGLIISIDKNIQHRHYAPSKGLLNKISQLNDSGICIGYISSIAESESRTIIAKAVTRTIEENWPKENLETMTQDQKLRVMDSFDVFRRLSDENLEENIALLCRQPQGSPDVDSVFNLVKIMYRELDQKYSDSRRNQEYVAESDKKWKWLRKSISHDVSKSVELQYKPNPGDLDKRMLAEAITQSKNLKESYFASFDKHFVSAWASSEITLRFTICPKNPADLIEIIKKKFKKETIDR